MLEVLMMDYIVPSLPKKVCPTLFDVPSVNSHVSLDIKVLRFHEPLAPVDHHRARRTKLIGKGPDGAAIYEEGNNIRLAQNFASSDVGWGHGGEYFTLIVKSCC